MEDFVSRFGANIHLNKELIVKRENRYFLLDETLKKLIAKDFYYAGAYLGKTSNEKFFPSFIMLKLVGKKKANKIMVNDKTAWLFICGRDVFKKGITQIIGSKKKGDYTLIINQYSECLGFGKILYNLDEEKGGVAIKNISDIGDFLRRER